jgi:hypothetical protein
MVVKHEINCRGKCSTIAHWQWHYKLHSYYVIGITTIIDAKVFQPPILEQIFSWSWIFVQVGKWMFWVWRRGICMPYVA